MPTDPRRFRFRIPQWSLFLLVTVVLVIVLGALSVWIPYHQEQTIVERINALEGKVYATKGGPDWLRWFIGDEGMKPFDRVGIVDLHSSTFTDADLAELSGLMSRLKKLRALRLSDSQVTDAGLAHLRGLTNLEVLHLSDTHVSDAGLVHLSGLVKLAVLDLSKTHVSNAGLIHLSKMTLLHTLHVGDTMVSHEGVAALQKELPNCEIKH
jgi:Ran GTPase-activating protein (RanGAP) involved in mRNA processing and transport